MAISVAISIVLTPTAFNDAECAAKKTVKLLNVQNRALGNKIQNEKNHLKFYVPILVLNFYSKSFLHFATHVLKKVSLYLSSDCQ